MGEINEAIHPNLKHSKSIVWARTIVMEYQDPPDGVGDGIPVSGRARIQQLFAYFTPDAGAAPPCSVRSSSRPDSSWPLEPFRSI